MSDNIKQTSWGYELLWASHQNYFSKLFFFQSPGKTDMHFHQATSKSWFINEGVFRIRWIDTKDGKLYESDLREGSVFHVPKLMPASIECLSVPGVITESGDFLNDDDFYVLIPSKNIGE